MSFVQLLLKNFHKNKTGKSKLRSPALYIYHEFQKGFTNTIGKSAYVKQRLDKGHEEYVTLRQTSFKPVCHGRYFRSYSDPIRLLTCRLAQHCVGSSVPQALFSSELLTGCSVLMYEK